MGIFDLFKNKKEITQPDVESLEPTENQFIDNSQPNTDNFSIEINKYGLENILDFVSGDFENRGYQDALINPDTSYKDENIELLIMDLSILIDRAKNHYLNYLKDIEFHIETRKVAGLIDTVQELESKTEKVEVNNSEVLKIEESINNATGYSKRISLSYSRGFNRGLASMSNDLLQKTIN
jgi:hypothetical protein